MEALNHLLRTLAAVPTSRRVLVRGAAPEGRVVGPLAQLGFEVHAAPWTDEDARRVYQATGAPAGGEAPERAARVYATAAPVRALPYPEAHFGWVVTRVPQGASKGEGRERLERLLEEARHHLRPGGWVFVLAPAPFTPQVLDEAAARAGLEEAEAPERAGTQVHAIYRRVEQGTPP